MGNDSGQSPRIGQRATVTNHGVQFITNETYPEAPWNGMMVYNTDVAQFQIFDVTEDGWLDPFTGATGNQTYVGDTAPLAPMIGDLWINTTDGLNILNRYDGGWAAYDDPRIVSAQEAAEAAAAAAAAAAEAAAAAQETADNAATSAQQAIEAAATAQDIADGKVQTFYSPTEPADAGEGDLWLRSTDKHLLRYDGSTWVEITDPDILAAVTAAENAQAAADGKITTYWTASDAPPTEGVGLGDLWFVVDQGNLVRRFDGVNPDIVGDDGWTDLRIGSDAIEGLGQDIYIEQPSGTAANLIGGLIVRDPANPNGEPLVRLHPLGCTFKGKVITDILTVMQDLIINGTARLSSGATLFLGNGVADPTLAPTIGSTQYLTDPWTSAALNAAYSVKGMAWDATRSCWWQTLWRDSNSRAYFRRIEADGTVQPVQLVENVAVEAGNTLSTVWGCEINVGGRLTMFERHLDGSTVPLWVPIDYNPTTGGALNYPVARSLEDTSPAAFYPASATDRTPATLAVYPQGRDVIFYDVTSTKVILERSGGSFGNFNVEDTGQEYAYLSRAEAPGIERALSMIIDDTDIGEPLLYIHCSTGQVYAFDYNIPMWYVDSGSGNMAGATKLNRRADRDFTISGTLTHKHSGTNQGLYSNRGEATIKRLSNYIAGTEKIWARHVDTNGALHTSRSPAASAVQPHRSWATVTAPPAPPGTSGAKLLVGYGAAEPTTYYERTEAAVGRAWTLSNGRQVGGALLPRKTVNITAKVLAGNVATLTSAAHGLLVGQQVLVAISDAVFDGLQTITAVAANTFSFAKVNANVGSVTGTLGTATTNTGNTLGGTPSKVYDGFGNRWDGNGVVDLPGLVQTADTGWKTMADIGATFFTNFANVASPGDLQFRKIGKVVYTRGGFTWSAGGTTLTDAIQLPVGWRPAQDVRFAPGLPTAAISVRAIMVASTGRIQVAYSAATGNAIGGPPMYLVD